MKTRIKCTVLLLCFVMIIKQLNYYDLIENYLRTSFLRNDKHTNILF